VSIPAVEFHQVTVRLGANRLLGPLSFRVASGETMVLLGESGSGKTTALRLINRLLDPSEGRVMVEGKETTAWDPVRLRRRIGYVIQEIGLLPHLSVGQNVGLVPRLEGWDRERCAGRVNELLDLVGLSPAEFRDRHPHQLSGGQRQRVGVARALAADPPMLLCDEAFGAVDPLTRAELQRQFRALTERLGKTVVFVTHDVREALILADRVVVLVDGTIAFEGTAGEFQQSQISSVRALRELQ